VAQNVKLGMIGEMVAQAKVTMSQLWDAIRDICMK
jgi:hypothetical protein